MKKIYKTIEREDGKITIYGSNRNIKTYYKKPEWNEYEELAFKYNGNEYFISEFMKVQILNPNPTEWMSEFNGILNSTAFSGILIKICDDADYIKAYTFVS